jgi:hypothetical protein
MDKGGPQLQHRFLVIHRNRFPGATFSKFTTCQHWSWAIELWLMLIFLRWQTRPMQMAMVFQAFNWISMPNHLEANEGLLSKMENI